MTHISLIEQIAEADTISEIRKALASHDLHTCYYILKYVVEELSEDVERHIALNHSHMALWTLSKLSFVEDHLLKLERKLHHVRSLERAGV